MLVTSLRPIRWILALSLLLAAAPAPAAGTGAADEAALRSRLGLAPGQELPRRPFHMMRSVPAGGYVDVLPVPGELPGPPPGPRGELLRKDLRTGELTRVEPAPLPADRPPSGQSMLPREIDALFDGPAPAAPGEDGPQLNFGAWTIEPDPAAGTYPRHVKLFMSGTDANGMPYGAQCSGTLIDPLHVLTAGHCIYTFETGGSNPQPVDDWVDDVQVVPGYENGNMPWGQANSAALFSWTGWTQNEDRDHDVGVIRLDRPLGAIVGWQGYGYDESCSYWTQSGWAHRGYPAENPFDGELMYTHGGSYDDCYLGPFNTVGFDLASFGGTSGSGSLRSSVVRGVLTASDRESFTLDTVITAGKYSDIGGWLASARPPSPDLHALDLVVGNSQQDVSSGGSLGGVSFRVHNYSSASFNGSVPYRIMMSADQVITGSDTQIHSGTLNLSLAPLGTFVAQPGILTVPPSTPSGTWYIGAILDISDADNSNNETAIFDQDWVNVVCNGEVPPVLYAPGDGATCQPASGVALDWSSIDRGTTYQVQGASSCGGFANFATTTSATQWTTGPLVNGATYHWRARSVSACGTPGPWSSCREFTVEDAVPTPVAVHPPDGDQCQPAYQVVVDWEDIPEAQAYQIRLSTQCGQPVTPITTTLSARGFLGLTAGQTYWYEIRAQGPCGNWGDWSECRSFTPKPSTMATPVQFFPPEGYGCAGDGFGVSWEAIDFASGYDVLMGQQGCGSGQLYQVSTNVMTLPPLNSGDVHWQVRSRHACGDSSAWSACHHFQVDHEAPPVPSFLMSDSHVPGQWSTNPALKMRWEEVADGGSCGIVQYHMVWGEGDQPPPEPWFTSVQVGEYTTEPLADSADLWFHIRAADGAGNYSDAPLSAGPFFIDTTPPTNPVVQPGWPTNQWTNAPTLPLAWSGAQDHGSGVAGYDWIVDSVGGTHPPRASSSPDSAVVVDPLDEGTHYLHLSTVDAVGLWSPTLTVGPFYVDRTPPLGGIVGPLPGETIVHGGDTPVEWEMEDGLSWVASYALWWSPNAYQDVYLVEAGEGIDLPTDTLWQVPWDEDNQVWLRLALTDAAGNQAVIDHADPILVARRVGVDGPGDLVPDRPALAGNVPNPFNPRTTIRFALPAAGPARLVVFDPAGRAIRTLHDGVLEGPAWHELPWDGRADGGQPVASGVYFYRLEAAGESLTRRMLLLK